MLYLINMPLELAICTSEKRYFSSWRKPRTHGTNSLKD
jgi:hypothetical protein